MSTSRTEYVIAGKFWEKSPFDYEDGNIESLMRKDNAGQFCLIAANPMCDSSMIAGVVMAKGDMYEGMELTELDFGTLETNTGIQNEIEKLGEKCELSDIKMYAFTCWG